MVLQVRDEKDDFGVKAFRCKILWRLFCRFGRQDSFSYKICIGDESGFWQGVSGTEAGSIQAVLTAVVDITRWRM